MNCIQGLFRAAVLFAALAASAQAQVPQRMNYQGYLTSQTGQPLTGTFALTFRIYAGPIGGEPLWQEIHNTVAALNGIFNVQLGATEPLALDMFSAQRFLSMQVGAEAEMSPRQALLSVPYAMRAATAEAVVGNSGQGGSVFIRWGRTDCPAGSELVYSGFVGGAHYANSGGAANQLCLAGTPSWGPYYDDSAQTSNLVYGTQLAENRGPMLNAQGKPARCAACLATARATFMLPGSNACPAGWTKLYSGYLVAQHYTQPRTEFVCMDEAPDTSGSSTSLSGNLWYLTEGACGSLPCPPYVQSREMTCSVCGK